MILAVTGMTSDDCAPVEQALKNVPGVVAVEMVYPERFVWLTSTTDVSIDALNDALASTSYEVTLLLGCC